MGSKLYADDGSTYSSGVCGGKGAVKMVKVNTIRVMTDVPCMKEVCQTTYILVASQACFKESPTARGVDIEKCRMRGSFSRSTFGLIAMGRLWLGLFVLNHSWFIS